MEQRDYALESTIFMSDFQQQKNVHYFPGHMAKALNALGPMVKGSDLIVEICDARAPFSTRNPMLSSLIGQKPHLLVLSKMDKADPLITQAWVETFAKQGLIAFTSDLKHEKVINVLLKMSVPLVEKKRAKEARLGMKKQPLRLLILGIPNVGKSTFINNLAGKKAARVANRPGVTRAEQWIKVSSDFILLDTPGILPMNYPTREEAVRLALLGSIKEEVLPIDDLALTLLEFLKVNYPSSLKERYGLEDIALLNEKEIYSTICQKRGYLLPGGAYDESKAAQSLIKDFQENALGKISLERS